MVKSILFIYAGDQQGSWGSIAFHKPQHYYVMPGILYCAQILRAHPFFSEYEITTRFINRSVESISEIADKLCSRNMPVLVSPVIHGTEKICSIWQPDIRKPFRRFQ